MARAPPHFPTNGSQAVASRDAELTAATHRAVAAEAEVQRLRERVAELERRG